MPVSGSTRGPSLQIYDPVLTNLARRYESHGFIAEDLLTNIGVSKLSGQYPIFDRFYWNSQNVDSLHQDRSETREVDFSWATEPYLAKEYALKVSITDLERDQADAAIRLEASKVSFLSQQMAIGREVRVANLLTKVADGGAIPNANSATPTNLWDTTAANPDTDLRTAALAVYNATGMSPNTLILPYNVAYNLATVHGTDTFRGSMLYTVNGSEVIRLGAGVLPGEIHGMKVVIAKGPQVTVANSPSGATYTEIWGKHARLLYVDPSAPWGSPTSLSIHQIEITSRCNLRCVYCPSPKLDKPRAPRAASAARRST
jgi:hypothetical protein